MQLTDKLSFVEHETGTIKKRMRWMIFAHVLVLLFIAFNNIDHGAPIYKYLNEESEISTSSTVDKMQFHGILSKVSPEAHAVLVIVVFDIAILLFVFQGMEKAAKACAIAMLIVNLIYWDFLGDTLAFGKSIYLLQPERIVFLLSKMIVKAIFAAGFSYFVHQFSNSLHSMTGMSAKLNKLYADFEQMRTDNEQLSTAVEESSARFKEKNNELTEIKTSTKNLNTELEEAKALIKEYKAKEEEELKERTCETCNIVFGNKNAKGKAQGGEGSPLCKSGKCKGLKEQANK